MDTSQEYIEMCAAAVEIQALRSDGCIRYIEAQDYWHTNDQGVGYGGMTRSVNLSPEEKWIWLPRQDQLQEICKDEKDHYDSFYVRFAYQVMDGDRMNNTIISHFKSQEQKWLSFMMYEKYKKRWNKETKTWIAI